MLYTITSLMDPQLGNMMSSHHCALNFPGPISTVLLFPCIFLFHYLIS